MFKSKYIKSFTAGLVLASGLFMSSGTSMAAKDFTDLYDDLSHTNSVLLLNGMDAYDYKQGTKLNGSAAVTRGEVSQILHNIFQYSMIEKRSYDNSFKDVSSNTKYYDAIVWSYEVGIFDGSNGKFNPDQTLTRAQMAKILVTMFNLKSDSKQSFKDTQNHWASDYISILYSNGYANGTGNGMFSPEGKLTLNQFSTFVYRLLMDGKEPFKDYGYDVDGIKTYEEVYAIAVDLYNARPYSNKEVVVYTAEDYTNKFDETKFYTKDISQYVIGYIDGGKTVGLTVKKVEDGLYETVISSYTPNSEEYENQVLAKIDKTVEHIKSKYKPVTDYEKVVAVNEFLAEQMTYDVSTKDHEFLLDGGGVCEDYANNVSVLLSGLGVQTRYLTGKTTTGPSHAWNAVKLDGEWYYTDVTYYDSDKGVNYSEHLLMTQSELDTYIAVINSDFRASNTPYQGK